MTVRPEPRSVDPFGPTVEEAKFLNGLTPDRREDWETIFREEKAVVFEAIKRKLEK